jgi:hypothetical protein
MRYARVRGVFFILGKGRLYAKKLSVYGRGYRHGDKW